MFRFGFCESMKKSALPVTQVSEILMRLRRTRKSGHGGAKSSDGGVSEQMDFLVFHAPPSPVDEDLGHPAPRDFPAQSLQVLDGDVYRVFGHRLVAHHRTGGAEEFIHSEAWTG